MMTLFYAFYAHDTVRLWHCDMKYKCARKTSLLCVLELKFYNIKTRIPPFTLT